MKNLNLVCMSKSLIKRSVIHLHAHGALPAKVVRMIFQVFRLRGC